MSISLSAETDNKVLIDALKYTSDIVVSLTEKMDIQEKKISQLEELIYELKNELKLNVQKKLRMISSHCVLLHIFFIKIHFLKFSFGIHFSLIEKMNIIRISTLSTG